LGDDEKPRKDIGIQSISKRQCGDQMKERRNSKIARLTHIDQRAQDNETDPGGSLFSVIRSVEFNSN